MKTIHSSACVFRFKILPYSDGANRNFCFDSVLILNAKSVNVLKLIILSCKCNCHILNCNVILKVSMIGRDVSCPLYCPQRINND